MYDVFHNNGVFQSNCNKLVFCLNLFFEIIHQPIDELNGFVGSQHVIHQKYFEGCMTGKDACVTQYKFYAQRKRFDLLTTASLFHRRTRIEIYTSISKNQS